MKTSTKIFIVITLALLVANIFLTKYLFRAIVPTESGFVFAFDTLAWVALAVMVAFNIFFFILFFKFLKSLKLGNMIFFSIMPLSLIYGGFLVYMTAVRTLDDQVATSVKAMMKIEGANPYINYLWMALATLIYLIGVFLIVWMACRPLGKVQKITGKLGDGRLKSEDFKVGGGKQFSEIEHSLNKINFNYKQKESKRPNNFSAQKSSKEFFKFVGKSGLEELELGNQIKKTATTMLCQIVCKNQAKRLSLEENFTYINSYLKVVCPLIKRYDGFVDKFLGDGIFAVFSKPQNAIECSQAILRAIQAKVKSQKEKLVMEASICLNTDELTLAVVGDDKTPTIISNQEELAHKMAEINEFIGSKLLISKTTLSALPSGFEFDYRYVGDLSLETEKLSLYESLGYYKKSKRDKLKKLKNKFEEGVRSYNLGQYERAKESFEKVLKAVSDDEISYVYFNKSCEKLPKSA